VAQTLARNFGTIALIAGMRRGWRQPGLELSFETDPILGPAANPQ
jgi:hypothetical protein